MDEKTRARIKEDIELYESMALHLEEKLRVVLGETRDLWSEKLREYKEEARKLHDQLKNDRKDRE